MKTPLELSFYYPDMTVNVFNDRNMKSDCCEGFLLPEESDQKD